MQTTTSCVRRNSGPRCWAVLLGLAACPLAAAAADTPAGETIPQNPVLQDTFRFTVGGFLASTSTIARLDTSTGGIGVDVNFEDALGLEDRKLVGEGAMYWRFARRWHFEADYFGITRRASRTISQDIQWGDETFTAGTDVNSSFRISDLRAAVGYSIFRSADKEVGLGLGLHTAGIRARVEAAGVGGEAGDMTAPLPVANFYGNFALTNTWALSTRFDWLSLAYDNYTGEIRSVALDFIWQPFRHAGFGFGYHSLLTNLGVDKTDWKGQVRLTYQGPSAYANFSF